MIDHFFNQSINVGEGGEKLVFALLQSLPKIVTVEDVSTLPEYRAIDVDFVATTESGDILQYELKTEPKAFYSKNLFFEFMSNEEFNTPGCFMYSEADYWISFIPQSGDVYILPLLACRKYVTKISKYRTLKRIRNIVGNGQYYSNGYAIPMTDVFQNVKYNHRNIKDIVDYEYIEHDAEKGLNAEFKDIVWKISP